jgi:hypothetical protein
MADVVGEFRHVTQLAALPGSPSICRLEEGKSERLVVGVNRKTPPFQHPAEVADAATTRQQLPIKGRVADLGRVELL